MAKKTQEISSEPKSRFDNILDKFNKSNKEPTFMIIDEETYSSSVPCISTGILSLDKILGSGLPCGRVIEIFGPNAAGKSTVCAQIVAHAQKLGGICAYIDAENAVDVNYFHRLGVDWKNVLFTQPSSGEEALNVVMNIIPMLNKGDVIVIDSVASLVPQSEINGEIGDSFMGIQARMMGQALRKLVSLVSSHNVILIFINQIREKLNVTYGSNETTPGGRALGFAASIRMDIRSIGKIKKGEEIVGTKTKIKIVKNKVFPPFKECEVDLIFGEGISPIRDLINLAIEYDIIQKAGAWFSYDGNQIGQGVDNSHNFLVENPSLLNEIEKKVREKLGMN